MNNSKGHIEIQEVNGVTRQSIPKENETIFTDFNQDLFKKAVDITCYYRPKEECPFNRGNWMIDIVTSNEMSFRIMCIRLPKEMTEDQVMKYSKPLIDYLESEKRWVREK